jgi:hypothetical protein
MYEQAHATGAAAAAQRQLVKNLALAQAEAERLKQERKLQVVAEEGLREDLRRAHGKATELRADVEKLRNEQVCLSLCLCLCLLGCTYVVSKCRRWV